MHACSASRWGTAGSVAEWLEDLQELLQAMHMAVQVLA